MQPIRQNFSVTFSYPVLFTENVFDVHNSQLRDVVVSDKRPARRKIIFFIDSEVQKRFPKLGNAIISYCKKNKDVFELCTPPEILLGGEQSKKDRKVFDHIITLVEKFGICRHSYIVAVGALIDAVGFAAAVAHRGIRLIRIPTTVLSQNDAGIGVKNGINYLGKKNFLGTFSPPFAVINDSSFLASLTDRDWRAGIAEALKVGLVKDADFFYAIQSLRELLLQRDKYAMNQLIYRCAEIHIRHIAGKDPFEAGTSRPLDFGHWSAHKLEQMAQFKIRHGEAVASGIALDSTYSYLNGMLEEKEWKKIISVLKNFGFKIYHKEFADSELLRGLDEFREHLGGILTVMLLKNIGTGIEVHAIDTRVVKKSIAVLRNEN
jgi:3-dehydroquinate synthase